MKRHLAAMVTPDLLCKLGINDPDRVVHQSAAGTQALIRAYWQAGMGSVVRSSKAGRPRVKCVPFSSLRP